MRGNQEVVVAMVHVVSLVQMAEMVNGEPEDQRVRKENTVHLVLKVHLARMACLAPVVLQVRRTVRQVSATRRRLSAVARVQTKSAPPTRCRYDEWLVAVRRPQ
jgi:hypothetical protein